ncbi:MAG: SpoIID/LytB domain protein, partial [Armatimonadetes bacterium]|nr:SpoIID/LytB domain protein [Armatimonadota bacterium]
MNCPIRIALAGTAALVLAGCTPPRPVAVQPPPSAAPAPAVARRPKADSQIRIGLASLDGAAAHSVKAPQGAAIYDGGTGQRLRGLPAGVALKVSADYASGQVLVKGKGIELRRPSVAIAGPLVQIGRRRYPGKVTFALGGTGLQLTNELDIEQYLEGVLPGELPAGFGIEAQKALAVAARSYALVQSGKHGG